MDFEFDREELVKVFVIEVHEHLDAMEQGVVALETRPDDQETIDTIFRGAHTIKGGALSLGFDALGALGHSAENILDQVRSGGLAVRPDLITLLLHSVDALRSALGEAVSGAEELRPEHLALIERLDRRAKGISEPRLAAAAAPADRMLRRRDDFSEERARSLRVDVSKLDRMLDLAGETAIARGRLRQILEKMGATEALEAHLEADRLAFDLQEMVMKVRMVPIGPIFRRYSRTVRDMAASHGKEARLVIEGDDIEADTRVIEHLADPLTHMVRNSIDHGLETPEARRASGKDPCGTLTLRAGHEGGSILIQLIDDGAGLSRERILKRARERGLVDDAARPTDAALFELVFQPGFSTAENVTGLSGRGVGMDVVRRNIAALRGTVTLDSREGHGTTVTIRLPLTLAIISGFGVGVGEDTYLIPIEHVVECLELPADECASVRDRGVISLRGDPLPYVRLGRYFRVSDGSSTREHVIVVRHGENRAGLAVERLHGESQTVIKPLGDIFKKVPGVAGSAILGNGRVALILDVPALLADVVKDNTASTGAGV